MAAYDPAIIAKFADRLYTRARSIVALYSIAGALIGLIAGGAAGSASQSTGAGVIIGGLILGILGYVLGQERAFSLKLQAQTALCQVQIEENTRKHAVAR